MLATLLKRHYPVAELDFRDLWDICSHFQRVHPQYPIVVYSIEGYEDIIVHRETHVAKVLEALAHTQDRPRKFVCRFYRDKSQSYLGDSGSTRLVYLPAAHEADESGLYYYGDHDTKLSLYKFEDLLYANFDLATDLSEPEAEFGHPCEVLVSAIDLRQFTLFCEEPTIESPYACGLMTSFYRMIERSFTKYPPDMMKYLGDGVLSIWRTSPQDREVAIDVCLEALTRLGERWREVLRGPHFSHGAPEGIGCGMAFGLASKICSANDYIGRPINIASRLCAAAPVGQVLIDKSVPKVREKLELCPTRIELKSYGDYSVWRWQ